MRLFVTSLFLLGLLVPAWAADDPPKKDDKPAADAKKSPADEWREIQAAQSKRMADYRTAMGAEKDADKRRELMTEFNKDVAAFADRCVKLAEAHPDADESADALFFAAARSPASPAGRKAVDLLATGFAAKADLGTVHQKLVRNPMQNADKIYAVVLERVEKKTDHENALDLLALISSRSRTAGKKAGEILFTKFIDSEKLDGYCRTLGNTRAGDDKKPVEEAAARLNTILEKNPHAKVKAAALSGIAALGKNRASEWELSDAAYRAAMDGARTALERVVKEYGESPSAAQAKKDLAEMEVRGVGKTAPEIKGEDVDAKEFKLSDYRGKVVLLDFWGHW
jgi:hypothetical protein